jgi:hypothetical protein
MASTTTPYALPDGRLAIDVSANKTLAASDQGIVQNVIADAKVLTLPSTAATLAFTVRNGGLPVTSGPAGTGANGTVLVALSPAAADAIAGLGFTATINKDAFNTKATSHVGDELTVVGSGTAGTGAWNVQANTKGIWAREV